MIALTILGFVLFPAAIVSWIVFSGKKMKTQLDAQVVLLTPSQTLAESALVAGATIELRARAVSGAHKVWLESHIASGTGRWTARATVAVHVGPPGTGYRDGAPEGSKAAETSMTFGEDGDGISVVGAASAPRTGALGIPREGGRHWLQLMALPSCAEGSELYVRVGLDALTAQRANFRAFIGVSGR